MTNNPSRALDDLRIDREAIAAPSRTATWSGVLAVVLAVGALLGWRYMPDRQAAEPTPPVAPAVTASAIAAAVPVGRASGFVTATRRTTVSSKVTGRLDEVFVQVGMRVRRGQVLARLNDANARVQLDLAAAQRQAAHDAVGETEVRATHARLSLERAEKLRASGLISQNEADAARSDLEALEAAIVLGRSQIAVADRQVAARQADLDDLTIRAPFDGMAISKDAQPGEMVSPISAGGGFTRTGICTIVDMASLEIDVHVAERAVGRIRRGQAVTAILDAYPEAPLPARVLAIVPAADRQTGTVLVRVAFERLDPRILPDMSVGVTFHESDAVEGGKAWH